MLEHSIAERSIVFISPALDPLSKFARHQFVEDKIRIKPLTNDLCIRMLISRAKEDIDDCFVTHILHIWTHLRVTSLSVSEKVNRKSLFFFWEAEMMCYLGKIGERHYHKGSK